MHILDMQHNGWYLYILQSYDHSYSGVNVLVWSIITHCFKFFSFQFSCVRLFATPWITARQASLSITNSRSSLRLVSIESVMPSSHLILCHPLLLLPPIPPSIKVFSNDSTLRMRWPEYWSFSFSITPSKEIPGLISFRMDWLDQQWSTLSKTRWPSDCQSNRINQHKTEANAPHIQYSFGFLVRTVQLVD